MNMRQLCDFCKEQRSMIYCKSDAAYLCLSCDRSIHSANALSKRHSRTLVCERCNSQIAIVRCIEENLSLCQNCNWSELSTSDSPTKHKRETINSYSGCPSAAELSKIWSFFYFDQPTCSSEAVAIIIEEAAVELIDSDVERFDGIESFITPNDKKKKGDIVIGPIPLHSCSLGSFCWSTVAHSAKKVCKVANANKDFDDSDIDWSMENCETLFGESFDDPRQFFEDGGFDNLFGTENFCDTERSENCIHEQACSNPVSADTDPNICCSPRPAQSSFSLSFPDHQTVEQETAVEQQNEGVSSSMVVIIEEQHPCNDHHLENQSTSTIRDCAVLRYKEKRKSRKFDGKVRYASRKAGAEVRKRVKGRFVKAGDPYDYDPLYLTNDFTLSKVCFASHVV